MAAPVRYRRSGAFSFSGYGEGMRKLAILTVLLGGSGLGAVEAVRWNESFVAAQVAARESGKPILALFWAEW